MTLRMKASTVCRVSSVVHFSMAVLRSEGAGPGRAPKEKKKGSHLTASIATFARPGHHELTLSDAQ